MATGYKTQPPMSARNAQQLKMQQKMRRTRAPQVVTAELVPVLLEWRLCLEVTVNPIPAKQHQPTAILSTGRRRTLSLVPHRHLVPVHRV
jgi:hypothetical protein